MSGILIYTPFEAKRNTFAINEFKKHLDVKLVSPDFDGDADFVINRTNDADIAKKFENKGIRVFNSSTFSELANDKDKCYRFMAKNDVNIMPIDCKEVPLVCKPKNGKGGKNVFLITKKEDIPNDNGNLVFQKVASDIGKDLRVWVIGNKIITSIMRVSTNDFRSNFCLGGTAILHKLSDEEEKCVQQIMTLISGDYYGIDFVYHQGKPVFNELEDSVGARMVYAKTNINIIEDYCKYIKNMI